MSEKYNTIAAWSEPDRGYALFRRSKRCLKRWPAIGVASEPVDLLPPHPLRNDPADHSCAIAFRNKELSPIGTAFGSTGRANALANRPSGMPGSVFV